MPAPSPSQTPTRASNARSASESGAPERALEEQAVFVALLRRAGDFFACLAVHDVVEFGALKTHAGGGARCAIADGFAARLDERGHALADERGGETLVRGAVARGGG